MSCLLAIDQGTSSTKAVLVDAAGRVLAAGAAPVTLSQPRPGWVEQDPEEIWQSVLRATADCLGAAGTAGAHVEGVTLSTQRESVLVWDRGTSRPLAPMIGWQDVRSAGWCAERSRPEQEAVVRERTGLRIDPMYSAPKISWLLEHAVPRQRHPRVCAGTVDSWLLWRLDGGRRHLTEAGNASRTLLLDLTTQDWSAELLELFDLPRGVLGEVVRSDGDLGSCQGLPGVADGVPVLAVMADSHAALLGQGCAEPGSGKATFGTGTSVMTPTDRLVPGSAVATTLAWLSDQPVYAREGNILSSGATLAWTAGLLGVDVPGLLELAATVSSADGVVLVPALTGLGAPHWDRGVRGVLTRLESGTMPAHVARAAVDAVAHQVCDVVEAMDADAAIPLQRLRADGGMTASTLVMQTQADLLGRPVEVAGVAELSALGSARLGWSRLGVDLPVQPPRLVLDPDPTGPRTAARQRWAADVAWLRTQEQPAG